MRRNFPVMVLLHLLLAVCFLNVLGAAVVQAAPPAPKWAAALFIEQRKIIGLRWQPTEGATEYVILRSETAGSGYKEIGRTDKPAYMDQAIEEGSTYYYVLQAVAGGEASPNSEEKEVTYPGVKKVAFNPPAWAKDPEIQQKTVFGNTLTNVGLFWTKLPNPDIVNYNVYRKKEGEASYTLIKSLSPQDTRYQDNELPEGTYSYALTATNELFEETAYSAEKQVVVKVEEKAKKKVRERLVKNSIKVRPTEVARVVSKSEDFPINAPVGLVVDDAGNYYTVDSGRREVLVFNSNGDQIIRSFGGDSGITRPMGIAVDSENGYVYVTDMQRKGLFKFTLEGSLIKEIPIPKPSGEELAKLSPVAQSKNPLPYGVAVSSEGTVYVADNNFGRVTMIDSEGTIIGSFGEVGMEDGQLNFPSYVGIGSKDRVLICNGFNRRLEVMDSKGEFVMKIGVAKDFVGSFLGLNGVVQIPDGPILVCDAAMATIQAFDPETGDYLYHLGAKDKKIDPDSNQRPIWDMENPIGVTYNPETGEVGVVEPKSARLRFIRLLPLEE